MKVRLGQQGNSHHRVYQLNKLNSRTLASPNKMQALASLLMDIGMATCPILGYVSQYNLIKANKSIGSFSIDICGILLFANVLRLNFYVFERYQFALVVQSLLMIAMQIVLLYECAKHGSKGGKEAEIGTNEEIETGIEGHVEDSDAEEGESFWRWRRFQKYGVTVLFFAFCSFSLSGLATLTPISIEYGQIIGILALSSQSILIAPQIYRNILKQSTQGLSYGLLFANLTGDIIKLIYFFLKTQPFQFVLCGVVQVVLDTFVILQIPYYARRRKGGEGNEGIEGKEGIEGSAKPNTEQNLKGEGRQMAAAEGKQKKEKQRQNTKGNKIERMLKLASLNGTNMNNNNKTNENYSKFQDQQHIDTEQQHQQHASQSQAIPAQIPINYPTKLNYSHLKDKDELSPNDRKQERNITEVRSGKKVSKREQAQGRGQGEKQQPQIQQSQGQEKQTRRQVQSD